MLGRMYIFVIILSCSVSFSDNDPRLREFQIHGYVVDDDNTKLDDVNVSLVYYHTLTQIINNDGKKYRRINLKTDENGFFRIDIKVKK